jgi:mannose-6-phosphate isomerase-like protein (cupin superfamily)
MPEKNDFSRTAAENTESYYNTIINNVNDHVVRMSIMTSPYPWHLHPNSDETFIGVEGIIVIETRDSVFELSPGSSVTIPQNMPHRTRPKGARCVSLTVEKSDLTTEFSEGKDPF